MTLFLMSLNNCNILSRLLAVFSHWIPATLESFCSIILMCINWRTMAMTPEIYSIFILRHWVCAGYLLFIISVVECTGFTFESQITLCLLLHKPDSHVVSEYCHKSLILKKHYRPHNTSGSGEMQEWIAGQSDWWGSADQEIRLFLKKEFNSSCNKSSIFLKITVHIHTCSQFT